MRSRAGSPVGRLSVRFSLIVLALSLFAIMIGTGVEVIRGWMRSSERVEENLELVRMGYLPSLAASLYVLDYDQLELLLQALLLLEGVCYVEVHEQLPGGREPITAGDPATPTEQIRQYPLQHRTDDGVLMDLGRMEVCVDRSMIRAQITRTFVHQVAMHSLLIFLTSALVLVVFQRLVARHLTYLAQYTRELDLESLERTPRMRRASRRDEIGQVVDAISALQERLRNGLREKDRAEKELEAHKDRLEELVEERSRELMEAQSELIKRERLAILGQLTATVSHEIRNPLGTVKNAVFSIRESQRLGQEERLERSLQMADRNIERCNRIITELLEYSASGPLNTETVDLGEWLEEVLREQDFPEDVQVKIELQRDLRCRIDRERMRRAVVNILVNAVQAMKETSTRRLTVETDREGDRLEMRIADTGCGMDESVKTKVFEPLFSLKPFGVGLGLAIVRDILVDHGGGIELESEKDSGTTVTLWVPAIP